MGADPVTIGLIAGGAMQIYGGYQANKAEAEAERANAVFNEKQAQLALEAAQREKVIFEDEADQFYGSQVNAFAKGGVDPSGSALMVLADTKRKSANEAASIITMGKRQAELSLLKATQSRNRANKLESFETNFLQAGSSALNTGALIAGRE